MVRADQAQLACSGARSGRLPGISSTWDQRLTRRPSATVACRLLLELSTTMHLHKHSCHQRSHRYRRHSSTRASRKWNVKRACAVEKRWKMLERGGKPSQLGQCGDDWSLTEKRRCTDAVFCPYARFEKGDCYAIPAADTSGRGGKGFEKDDDSHDLGECGNDGLRLSRSMASSYRCAALPSHSLRLLLPISRPRSCYCV